MLDPLFVDTSTIIRAVQPHDPNYAVADGAIQRLPEQGWSLHIAPQNLIEVWAVATRPAKDNGLALPVEEANALLLRLKGLFTVVEETPAIYPMWEQLVTRHRVTGKPTHDARLAATMMVHGIAAVLTFDKTGFSRFPGIRVIHPADVAAGDH